MVTLIIWLALSIAALVLVWLSSKFELASTSPKLKIASWSFVCLIVSIIAGLNAGLTIVTYIVIALYCTAAIVANWHAVQEDATEWYNHLRNCFKKS